MRKIGIICAGDEELEPFLPNGKDGRIAKSHVVVS